MKIASYNLHFGGKTGGPNLWERLFADFSPDVVCAQESREPASYGVTAPFAGQVWRQVPDRDWGSAIVSVRHELEEIKLNRFEGSVVGARLRGAKIGGIEGELAVFSIHAPTDKSSNYVALVGRILDEIEGLGIGKNLILAGDFNVTTAYRLEGEDYSNSKQELAILDRLRNSFGLKNAWQACHPDERLAQTLRWNRNPATPYHCDAIFVHESHVPHLASAEILNTGIWGSASDHNPIVVELR